VVRGTRYEVPLDPNRGDRNNGGAGCAARAGWSSPERQAGGRTNGNRARKENRRYGPGDGRRPRLPDWGYSSLSPAAGLDGFLYVTDLGTSGKSSLLFPGQETGSDNRIDHSREYVVPATPDGWFEVSGPAGYETLYFVMSPVALAGGSVPNAAPNPNQGIPQGTPPPTMHPRCNDAIFKSRGDCVDPNAGPKRVEPSAPLPGPVRDLFGDSSPGEASRDLKFSQKSSSSVVTSVSPISGPVVYEFLLAHN
jgi:hypothetical protein